MRGLVQVVLVLTIMTFSGSCSNVHFSSNNDGSGGGDGSCSGSACANATYSWYEGGYHGVCSKPCGGGVETQVVECHDATGVVVADTFCTGTKPASSRGCNLQACSTTYTWNIGPYGDCSKSCGTGTKTRSVLCQDSNGTTTSDNNCSSPKPDTSTTCNTDPCVVVTYSWQVTPGACSKPCGGGTATDTVVCKKNDGTTVADSFCDPTTKPPTTRQCNTQTCPVNYTYSWEPQPWSVCSKTCDGGIQTRSIACKRNDGVYVSDTLCDPTTKPAIQQSCNTQPCNNGNKVTQTLYVTPALNSVDVIMVVDDSSSMKEDQSKLAQRMIGLLSDLDTLKVDYQVCLTTTDTGYYKGSPIKWVGLGSVIMNKNSANKNQVFIDTINSLGAEWSSDERAINNVNLMLRDFRATGCMRDQSTLTTIIISDEDERSVGGDPSLSSVQYIPLEPMDYPDNLIQNVHTAFDKPGFVKPFIWNSIIVKPGDAACEAIQDAQSSPSFPGRLYAQLSNKTGGYIGSICDSDYTQNLKYIKDKVVNSMPGMTLQCVPIDTPVVTFDKPVTTTVTLTGNQLKFSPVIPEGVTITAKYTCP